MVSLEKLMKRKVRESGSQKYVSIHLRFFFLPRVGSDADPDPVPFWPLDPGSGAFLAPGSGIRDEQPWSYFRELGNHFFGLNHLNSLMRSRDKNTGYATLRVGLGKKICLKISKGG
jgi:hypothetical protein